MSQLGKASSPNLEMRCLLPEAVIRLIALGERLADNGVVVTEEVRLKGDELSSKGATHGLSYFEKRLLMLKGVLEDKGLVLSDELKGSMERLREEGAKLEDKFALEVHALARLCVKKGLVDAQSLDIRYNEVGSRTPMTGAKIIAKAWRDPEFKRRLLEDARQAILSLDPSLLAPNTGEPLDSWRITKLIVLENTEKVRNVVVCTLCSCYPRGLLGEPPEWYTSDSYKERLIKEPRLVLKEMGLELPEDMEIRVYDSTADVRYMVLPLRPKGSEGLSEEELAKTVTRDCLIGVADPSLEA